MSAATETAAPWLVTALDARTALLVWCAAAGVAGEYFPRHFAAVVRELGPTLGRVPTEGERGRIAPYALPLYDMAAEAWRRSDQEVRLWEKTYGWSGPSPRGCAVHSVTTDRTILSAQVCSVATDGNRDEPTIVYNKSLSWHTSVHTRVCNNDPRWMDGWEVSISPHHVTRVAAAEAALAAL